MRASWFLGQVKTWVRWPTSSLQPSFSPLLDDNMSVRFDADDSVNHTASSCLMLLLLLLFAAANGVAPPIQSGEWNP